MKLRFLGTGTSFGVPVLGCACRVCRSTDPRDRRMRHGALLSTDDGARRLLVDTPPELRLQLVDAGVSRVDAVWFTHAHADHIHGVDDLRAFSVRSGEYIHACADATCAATLRQRFDYIFDDAYVPPAGTSKPRIRLQEFGDREEIELAGFTLRPLPVAHGDTVAYGFRVGGLGYVTDAKVLDDEVLEALRGVRVLVLNALWFGSPHPTHMNVEEALAVARRVGAQRTYLTHLTHRVSHAELLAALPAGILPAHDGLEVEIP